MKKTSRTYRLSGNALEAVENRDKNLYPKASDFVEGLLLQEYKAQKEGELLAMLEDIRQEIAGVRQMLQEERRMSPPIPKFD